MATIEDLPSRSITEMSIPEALELLREIRLSRRTPKKTKRKAAATKAKKKEKQLTPEQAMKILELLGEDS